MHFKHTKYHQGVRFYYYLQKITLGQSVLLECYLLYDFNPFLKINDHWKMYMYAIVIKIRQDFGNFKLYYVIFPVFISLCLSNQHKKVFI